MWIITIVKFIKAPNRKQPECPSIKEWLNKLYMSKLLDTLYMFSFVLL